MRSTQHTALVTGGATCIGFALAEKFHAHGNRVILVGRTAAALARELDLDFLAPVVETSMTRGRGKGKISPAQLADEFWIGFQAEHFEMLIGKTKLLHWLRRLSPSLTDRIMRVQSSAEPAQRH